MVLKRLINIVCCHNAVKTPNYLYKRLQKDICYHDFDFLFGAGVVPDGRIFEHLVSMWAHII